MVETLALEVDLLKEETVNLLELHLVLVRKFLQLRPEALDLGLEFSLILVDRLPEGLKNVKLIAIDEGHY